VIDAGVEETFSTIVFLHPVGSVYVIVADPAATPETTPLTEPTIATEVLPLLHVPPTDASDRVAVNPIQYTEVSPPMGAGNGSTVTVVTAIHPEGAV
jgi:hypothetical protein